MRKIKIAQIVTRLEYGGVESVILNHIKYMKTREDFDFHIITQDINAEGCIKLFENCGCTVHIVTHKRKSIIKNIREIYQIFKNEKFDIVHSHMNLTNFYVLLLAQIVGTKVRISHVHSALIADSFIRKVYYSLMTFVNRVCSNRYVTCGKAAGEFYFGQRNMASGRVKLFNNAIYLEPFKYNEKVRCEIRKKYSIDDDSFVIGHIGRFMEVKNHSFLLDIFRCVLEDLDNARLMLVGTGELFATIQKKACDMGISDKVIFVGSTNHPYHYYQAMDAFVLPSYYEGFPVVSIEAQCVDLACFFSDKIDKSCKVIDCLKFLSINDSAEQWKDCIVSCRGRKRSAGRINEIKNAGYDIQEEAESLAEYYKRCCFES